MIRFGVLALSVAALGLAIRAATAADIPSPVYKDPPVAVVRANWSGCHVGITGGRSSGQTQAVTTQSFNFGGTPPILAPAGQPLTERYSLMGVLVGGTIGCDHQVASNWVVGIENDLSWTSKKAINGELPPFASVFPNGTPSTNEVKEHWIDTLRARLGVAVGPQQQVLLYVTGGGAFTRATDTVCVPSSCESVSRSRIGWTVGGGVEWALLGAGPVQGPWWSLKLEYLYVDFGGKDYLFDNNADRSVDLRDQIVRAGLNLHF